MDEMQQKLEAEQGQRKGIEMDRVVQDRAYREELAQTLLSCCEERADHVDLRRTAVRIFPELAGSGNAGVLASIVGQAATLRIRQAGTPGRDVTDARLETTAKAPLAYPDSYAQMDDGLRAIVTSFCEEQLRQGCEGPEALSNLLQVHGWPYSERTFYVGPWKAARLRERRRSNDA